MKQLLRIPGWELHLAAYLAARHALPFAWVENDCVTFAAGAVAAETGEGAADLVPAGYTDRRSAIAALRRLGGLEQAVEQVLGSSQAPALARIGDVGVCTGGGRRFLAVCNGTTWLGPGPHGIAAVGLLDAICSWRVG